MKTIIARSIRISLAVIALSTFMGLPGFAAAPQGSRNFGLGIELGEPSGITAKLWLNQVNALDFGLSFSFDDYFLIYADYLIHFNNAFGSSSQFVSELTPYVGVGGEIAFANSRYYYRDRHFFGYSRDTIGVGVRVPLGIEWTPAKVPLGVFIQIVPGLTLIPRTGGIVEGSIGIRYYF